MNKQIEEMARDMCPISVSCEECLKLASLTGQNKEQYCKPMKYAKKAYENNYRKANEIFDDIERLMFAYRFFTAGGTYYRKELKDAIAELKRNSSAEEHEGGCR